MPRPFTPRKKPPIIGHAKELMMGEIVIRIEVIVPKDANFFSGLTWDLRAVWLIVAPSELIESQAALLLSGCGKGSWAILPISC